MSGGLLFVPDVFMNLNLLLVLKSILLFPDGYVVFVKCPSCLFELQDIYKSAVVLV